jgi:TP901 family phage tail tape measure protein
MMDSVSETVSYLKDLDESLTNIRLVTDYSKEDMREFAEYANQAAKALGSTTVAYTDAALVFAQQGYGLEESETLANYSIKLANVTGQSTDTTSDQITSYMNAFGISLDDLSGKLDEWAEVANISAADVEELSVAAQKAAATANAVGVSTEQLNAQIATIESVTRDAPKIILGRPIGNYWLKCA